MVACRPVRREDFIAMEAPPRRLLLAGQGGHHAIETADRGIALIRDSLRLRRLSGQGGEGLTERGEFASERHETITLGLGDKYTTSPISSRKWLRRMVQLLIVVNRALR